MALTGWIEHTTDWTPGQVNISDSIPRTVDTTPDGGINVPIWSGSSWSWDPGEDNSNPVLVANGGWNIGFRPTKVRFSADYIPTPSLYYSDGSAYGEAFGSLIAPEEGYTYPIELIKDIGMFLFPFTSSTVTKIEFYVPGPDAPEILWTSLIGTAETTV